MLRNRRCRADAIAFADNAGHVFVSDRQKGLIVIGGLSWYPGGVKHGLVERPEVFDDLGVSDDSQRVRPDRDAAALRLRMARPHARLR